MYEVPIDGRSATRLAMANANPAEVSPCCIGQPAVDNAKLAGPWFGVLLIRTKEEHADACESQVPTILLDPPSQ
jgi:hypothetical protein